MIIEKIKKYNLILGSNSPRRKKIIEEMGFKVNIIPANIDETIKEEISLEKIPVFLANEKSKALKNLIKQNDILITADTIVIFENKILNKPKNKVDAIKTLSNLSSKTHKVITGVCIRTFKSIKSFSCSTKVTFEKITDEEINYYIQKYEPFDKAGSYGIQEWIGLIGIKKIEGSYSNVVGLPSSRLYQELKMLF